MNTRDVAMAIVLETGAPRNHAVCVVAMIFSLFWYGQSKLRNYVSGGVSQEKKKDIISSQPTSQTNSTNSGQLARANRSR